MDIAPPHPRPSTADVIIAGGGPSAALLARACAGQGLEVMVVAPDLDASWTARYAVWCDEWEPLGLPGRYEGVWPRVTVRLDDDRAHVLGRRYATLDNAAVKGALLEALPQPARVVDTVVSVVHGRERTHVRTAGGRELQGRLFVDATGGAAPWTLRHAGRPGAFQTALGWRLRGAAAQLPEPASMTLMDYRSPQPGSTLPTFLYAMPMANGDAFVEETVLIHRPAIPHATLEALLRNRLSRMGISTDTPVAVERCTIAMDLPLPVMPQRTLAFGAAAGYVHPATGYMVGYAAAMAPRVARAIGEALSAGSRSLDDAAAGVWEAIWPREALRVRALFLLGATAVAGFDAAATRDFFDTFFALDRASWSAYLARSLSVAELAPIMWRIYRRSDGPIRRALRAEFLRRPILGGAALLGVGPSALTTRGGPPSARRGERTSAPLRFEER